MVLVSTGGSGIPEITNNPPVQQIARILTAEHQISVVTSQLLWKIFNLIMNFKFWSLYHLLMNKRILQNV